ncbi:MAG TPA: response regulator transcription factor, partial [Bryobacteraceae bacterium]|nr:response regulator transcription factor [Bryobacteraceae bacterium]
MSRVLVVEDEQHLADGLRFNLEAEGYDAQVVESGEEALRLLLDPAIVFDVLVLDIMLPGKDGFLVMSELREAGQYIPTLMLTARGHPDDVLRGFAAGADDYLNKPFELSILTARINGLIRRKEWLRHPPNTPYVPQPGPDLFRFGRSGEKAVDFNLLQLSVRDQVFRLTLMEGNVLRYLIRHEGKPVSRRAMIQE